MDEKSPFPLDVLEYNLDERRDFINDHDEEMEYICSCLSNYHEDVIHAIEYGLSHSVVSHFTYNLVLVLAKGLTSLTIYEYMRGAYLLEEDYNNVYKVWKSIHDSAKEIIPLLANLEEENYFDEDIEIEDFLADILPPHCDRAKGFEKLLNLHRRVSLKTGSSLINTLICYLRHMEQWLTDFKNSIYKDIMEEYDRVYWANYNLYKKEYWPKDGKNFRSHIENENYMTEEITSDYLAKRLWNEKYNFEQTPTGQLWRDYIDDKKDLYFEAKRISLNEEQWRYFFRNICRFEEYEKWIEELKHPEFIEKEYPDSVWDKIFKDNINIKKVKQILPSLLPKEPSITDWFVCHKVIEEIEWFQDDAHTHFILWVKDVYVWPFSTEHFKSVNGRLKEKCSLDWDARTMTSSKISLSYKELADNIRKEFVTMDGRIVKEDNKRYLKTPQSYIEHTKKL